MAEGPIPSDAIFDLLGVAEQVTTTVDPVSFLRSLAAVGAALPRHPRATVESFSRLASGIVGVIGATARRTVGDMADGPCPADSRDRRFGDPAFEQNPYFFALAAVAPARLSNSRWTSWPRPTSRRSRQARPRSPRSSCSTRSRRPTRWPATRPRCGRRSIPAARAWFAAPATSSTTCATTAAGPSRSTRRRSQSASIWPRAKARWSTAATSSS